MPPVYDANEEILCLISRNLDAKVITNQDQIKEKKKKKKKQIQFIVLARFISF